MMLNHQPKGSGMDHRRRLEELNEQEKLWRKQHLENERRMKEDFERRIAQLEEDFAEAERKLEMEFNAKKEAVRNSYNGKIGRDKSAAALISCDDKAKAQIVSNDVPYSTLNEPQQSTATRQAKPSAVLPAVSVAANVECVNKPVVQPEKSDVKDDSVPNLSATTMMKNDFVLRPTVRVVLDFGSVGDAADRQRYLEISTYERDKNQCRDFRIRMFVFDPGGSAVKKTPLDTWFMVVNENENSYRARLR